MSKVPFAVISPSVVASIYRREQGSPDPSLLMCYDKLGGKRFGYQSGASASSALSFSVLLRDLYIPSVFLFNAWSRDWRSLHAPLNILSIILPWTCPTQIVSYSFQACDVCANIDTCSVKHGAALQTVHLPTHSSNE